jgi:hypothetical protein
LRAQIGADDAHPIDEDLSMGTPVTEAAGFGEPKVEADNEVWTDLRRNPSGRGQFSRSLRYSSLTYARYARSSRLDIRKIGSRRCRPQLDDTP